MSDNIANNKRIAKNTIFLYLRMFFTMGITLYTSRIVLQALGATDFGLFNVVAGVVSMTAFINSSLMLASSRFITYSLGLNNQEELQKTFNSLVTIHLLFSLIIIIIGETVGLWFVENKLSIPVGKNFAVCCSYQCAILATVMTFLNTPHNSLIVAHEKMGFYAYISIYEKIALLVIAYLLYYSEFDKLILYSILFVAVQISVRVITYFYCRKHFEESKFTFCLEKERIKKVFAFAGWVFNGNLAYLCYTEGLNILLNIYFGPIVNAARGLSLQVQGALQSFTNNFQTAVNPQIIKSHAEGEFKRMHSLVISSSKFGFYLMLIVVIPIYFNTEYILSLWLSDVPDYTTELVQIMLIVALNTTLRNPTVTAIHATGKIKKFQLWEGTILLFILPTIYLFIIYFHISPVEAVLIYLFYEILVQFVRVVITYPSISLRVSSYFTGVLWPCLKVTVITVCFAKYISIYFDVDNFLELIGYTISCLLIVLINTYIFGISKNERSYVTAVLFSIKKKLS